jgi:hypothetical protein
VTYDLVEFREPAPQPGVPYEGRSETLLGRYDSENTAVEHGRLAWGVGRESESTDVAWWIVRRQGELLARWIADAGSDEEQILDLTTNTMITIDR